MAIGICLKPKDTGYKKPYVFLYFHLFPTIRRQLTLQDYSHGHIQLQGGWEMYFN